MTFIIGSSLIYWIYKTKAIDPVTKIGLYVLVTGMVYYLGR